MGNSQPSVEMGHGQSVPQLIEAGILSFAIEPKDNPQHLTFPTYTVSLIEHDYPAKTAVMWNAAYRSFSFRTGNCMLVGDPAHLDGLLSTFRADPKYLGGGVGIGFKEITFKHADECDGAAQHLNSVNFLVKTKCGRLRGYNTDGVGYARSLEAVFERHGGSISGKRILLLGAGGTSRAVAFALANRGCPLTISNRTMAKAQALCDALNAFFGTDVAVAIAESATADSVSNCDVIVNVSSVGSAGPLESYSPLAPVLLPPTPEHIQANQRAAEQVMNRIPSRTVLSDVVITATGTPLLRLAKEKGFTVLDGIPMVINQAVESFRILHSAALQALGVSFSQLESVMRTAAHTI
jgi:shikimate dehydrogenase